MPKRTYQPKKKRRKSRHGFRKRMGSRSGRKIIKRRKLKRRKVLST